MKQWQLDALKAIEEAREEYIRDIHIKADQYRQDVINGEDYRGITKSDIMEWLWESA